MIKWGDGCVRVFLSSNGEKSPGRYPISRLVSIIANKDINPFDNLWLGGRTAFSFFSTKNLLVTVITRH